MKKILFTVCSGLLLAACTGNDAQVKSSNELKAESENAVKDSANYTTIQWLDSTNKNMGKIVQGQTLEISWKFRNSGDKPLYLADVKAGCGCTGAKGPEAPIAPGKEGVITATFNSQNYPGMQTKSVYVIANNRNKNNESQDVLNFTVEVEPKK